MKIFLSGGSGFIGSSFTEVLLKQNNHVTIYDNLSSGFKKFNHYKKKYSRLKIINGDLKNFKKLKKSIKNHDIVFHFAANADVRYGFLHPRKDLEQNIICTHNVLEAMRANDVKKIVFSSTGSVYGEAKKFPIIENSQFPIQTSFYASSKLASEAFISSYCEGYNFKSWIFRFVSILGPKYSHGHVFDFYKKLLNNKNKLNVLGNGMQKKSYLHIDDCISGVLKSIKFFKENINIINIGHDEYINVKKSVGIITKQLKLKPKIIFSSKENKGWIGDNSFIFLSNKKLKKTGWKPKHSIEYSIIDTLNYLKNNKWILKRK